MGNEKALKDNNNELASDVGKMLLLGIAALAAWAVIIFLSFSASLATMAEKLREHGYNEWEILKSKTWRVVGILPFVLILAYFTADHLPKNLTFKSALIFKAVSEKEQRVAYGS